MNADDAKSDRDDGGDRQNRFAIDAE